MQSKSQVRRYSAPGSKSTSQGAINLSRWASPAIRPRICGVYIIRDTINGWLELKKWLYNTEHYYLWSTSSTRTFMIVKSHNTVSTYNTTSQVMQNCFIARQQKPIKKCKRCDFLFTDGGSLRVVFVLLHPVSLCFRESGIFLRRSERIDTF